MPNDIAPTLNQLVDKVKIESVAAFDDLRAGIMDTAKTVIIPQMRQIATAVWDVMDGLAEGDYTPEGAAELLQMARRAAATVISGATELLFTEVEAAVNRVFAALREMLSGAVNAVLDRVL